MSMSFCPTCLGVARGRQVLLAGKGGQKEVQKEVQELKYKPFRYEAFQYGCELCSIFERIAALYEIDSYAKHTVTLSFETVSVKFEGIKEDGRDHAIFFQLFTNQDLPCPWSIFPVRRLQQNDAHLTATQWLQDCAMSHQCGAFDEKPLPTRIIHIGSSNDEIKLMVANGQKRRYICLSHCWGTYLPLKTTRENLQSHKASIPWRSIPKTFQDAILWTRKLGIQYLWIDSICIIQDDPLDWERESSRMAGVYSNSYVTLAATSSADSSEGLYHPPTRPIDSIAGISQDLEGAPYQVFATQKERPHPFRGDNKQNLDLFPLLTRGWAFQEHLLSPRTLHFGVDELYWECFESIDCQCGDGTWELDDSKLTRFDGRALRRSSLRDGIANVGKPSVDKTWRGLAAQYSCCLLTDNSDRLAAISGIASKTAAYRQGARYLAGLWSDTLIFDLLWLTEGVSSLSEMHSIRPKVWRAPSWSWAAVDCAVLWPDTWSAWDLQFAPSCQVIDIDYSVNSLNPYDNPAKGRLQLKGLTVHAELHFRQEVTRKFEFIVGNRSRARKDEAHNYLDDHDDVFATGSSFREKQKDILCLQMGLSGSLPRIYTLLLHCVNEENQEYIRIGMAEQYLSDFERTDFWVDGGVQKTITLI